MANPKKSSGGFTLLEMLAAVTIMAFLTVLLFTAFHQGQKGWVHGEKRAQAFADGRRLLNTIANDVYFAVATNNFTFSPLNGTASTLEFVAPISRSDSWATNSIATNEVVDLCWVKYEFIAGGNYIQRSTYAPLLGTTDWTVYRGLGAKPSVYDPPVVLTSNIVISAWFAAVPSTVPGAPLPRAVRIHVETVDPTTMQQIAAGGNAAALTAAAKRTFETQVYLLNSR